MDRMIVKCLKFRLAFYPVNFVVNFSNGIHIAIQHSFLQVQIKDLFFILHKPRINNFCSLVYQTNTNTQVSQIVSLIRLSDRPMNSVTCFASNLYRLNQKMALAIL